MTDRRAPATSASAGVAPREGSGGTLIAPERAPGAPGRLPGRGRPSSIAKSEHEVRDLVRQAIANGWWMRLCWRDDEQFPGESCEDYALPVVLRDGWVIGDLAGDEPLAVGLEDIVWARVATSAEEEANDLVEDFL